MTSRRTLNMLFVLHSWSGLVTGLLLFVVCFSGSVVVFKNEIDLWANPSLRELPRSDAPVSPDTVLATLQRTHPTATVETLVPPGELMRAYMVYVRLHPGEGGMRTKLAVRADTGELIGPVDSQLGQYIRMLHVFFFFGPRWIVGFLGVVMLVLIGTGFVIHRKIIAELFTQRWDRSLRVVMSDLHKSAGIWGLAFHLLIAFTGAWLGLAPVFERSWDYVVLAATSTSVPAKTAKPRAGKSMELVPMTSLTVLADAARSAVPGFQPKAVSLQRWGQIGATATWTGELAHHLHSTASVHFDGVTGRIVRLHDPRRQGFWSQVNGLMEPLHFGDFGGLGLKWLYFMLGLTPAFLSLTGTVIWLDSRRQRQATRQARSASDCGASAGRA